MLENQQEALSLLRQLVGISKTSSAGEMLEDVLPKQLDFPAELDTVCDRLVEDQTFKGKMVTTQLISFVSHSGVTRVAALRGTGVVLHFSEVSYGEWKKF